MYPVWWCLCDTLVPLDSTYASPGPPKWKQKFEKMFIRSITSIFCILLSFGVILRCLWGLEAYVYIKCLWVLLTNVYWFRATGGYICGCGRSSNLVSIRLDHVDLQFSYWNFHTAGYFHTDWYNWPVFHLIKPPKEAKVYPASRRRSNKMVGLKGQLAPHCVPWLKNSIMAYKRLSTSLGSKTLNNTSSLILGGPKSKTQL